MSAASTSLGQLRCTGQPLKQSVEQQSHSCHFGKDEVGSQGWWLLSLSWRCFHQGLSLQPGEERGLQQSMGTSTRRHVPLPLHNPSRAVQTVSKWEVEGEPGGQGCLLQHTWQKTNSQRSQRQSSHCNECCLLSKRGRIWS